MSVLVTPIDGQNVGLRLLGQTSVDVFSLDLTSGGVSSDFFGPSDREILSNFALALFGVVPKSARSAAAIGLLSRLVSVSPADASTVTVAASVVGGVATLIASVTASPASIILTIPYSMSGGVMPGQAGGGPTPPPAPDPNLIEVELGEELEAGQPVCLVSGVGLLARGDDPTRIPAVGILESLEGPTSGVLRVGGISEQLSGLLPGRVYFVGADGSLVSNPPVVGGQAVQAIGFSLSNSQLTVAPSSSVAIR